MQVFSIYSKRENIYHTYQPKQAKTAVSQPLCSLRWCFLYQRELQTWTFPKTSVCLQEENKNLLQQLTIYFSK